MRFFNWFVIFCLLVAITATTIQETEIHYVHDKVKSVQDNNLNSNSMEKLNAKNLALVPPTNSDDLVPFVEAMYYKLAALENENQKMKEQIQILLLRQDNTVEKLKNVDNVAQNAQSSANWLWFSRFLDEMFK